MFVQKSSGRSKPAPKCQWELTKLLLRAAGTPAQKGAVFSPAAARGCMSSETSSCRQAAFPRRNWVNMWPGLVHSPLPGKKRHVEVRMLKADKMVLDTCIQAALLPRNGEFSNVSVLEVIPAMEAQTLNSASSPCLTVLQQKFINWKGRKRKIFLNIPRLSMRRLEGKGERRLLFSLFVREPCHSSQPEQGGCSCEGASSKWELLSLSDHCSSCCLSWRGQLAAWLDGFAHQGQQQGSVASVSPKPALFSY